MKKLILIKPALEYIDEIRAYRQEFFDSGSKHAGDSGLRKASDIKLWIEYCRLMECRETVPNPDWVDAEQYMLIYEGEKRIIGMINFRHTLNEHLAKYDGHIGYAVRPSERRKGYAKSMLVLCLEKCREFGLNQVLLSCNNDNEASRRTILACGGIFNRTSVEDDGTILELYWVSTRQM